MPPRALICFSSTQSLSFAGQLSDLGVRGPGSPASIYYCVGISWLRSVTPTPRRTLVSEGRREMKGTHIGPRTVFVVCVAALSACYRALLRLALKRVQSSKLFSTRSPGQKPSCFEGVQSPSRPSGPAPPTSRFSASPAGEVTMVGIRSGDDSTGRVRRTRGVSDDRANCVLRGWEPRLRCSA